MSDPNLSSFIWSVADLLRGDYKQSEYGKVILPFTVLRRLDCVLESTKAAVLAELAKRTKAGVNPEPFLLRKSGQLFYNTSPLDLKRLMGDQDHIGENLRAYMQAFSPAVRDIFESFEFHLQIDRLQKAGLLYLVTEKFANIDLHPDAVSNAQMGAVFEELIRQFAELSNETAGEHFTPREVIRLMVNLLFIEDDEALTKPGVVRSLYDPTAGTGGMLSVAGEHLASRVEAVRWKLAIEKYIQDCGYKIGTIVAFSGEVNDPESGPDGFTETSKILNPNLRSRDIREAFKGDEYQILLVANKFQTGFDQPLLCGMYVDKRLAGVQAVQTLSRLNRAHPGKDTTYVLDFVNDPVEVLAAFKTYHTTAELSAPTDPNLVYNLRAKLDAAGHYDEFEVDRVVEAELKGVVQKELIAALEPVADRLLKRYQAAQTALKLAKDRSDEAAGKTTQDELNALILFKSDMGAFIRLYTFLSQIFDYGNTALEKRAIFFRRLLPLLEFGREREGIDLSKVVLTHHNLKNLGKRPMPLYAGEVPKLEPITEAGSGMLQDKEKAFLDEIIQKVNELFDGELTDQDKLVYVNNVIKGKLLESDTLRQQAANNTKEQFANSPDLKTELLNAIMGALDAHTAMSTQALNSPTIQRGMKDILLNHSRLWETLRAKKPAIPDRATKTEEE